MSGVEVQARGVCKAWKKGGQSLEILQGVDVDLSPGERVAIVGRSGSGKSSFLHLLGLLDVPTAGRILLDGREVTSLSARAQDRVRGRRIGFVFQAHHLLPEHDALANVMAPVRLAGGSWHTARVRAQAMLDAVGLSHRASHRPGEMSGGEQQRVAIARALVMGPGLVLADEPTGNLDPETAESVFHLLLELNRQLGSTLVVVTHALELATRFPRVLELREGALHEAA